MVIKTMQIPSREFLKLVSHVMSRARVLKEFTVLDLANFSHINSMEVQEVLEMELEIGSGLRYNPLTGIYKYYPED